MKSTSNKNHSTNRNLFLTLALVLGTTVAFAQDATAKHAINTKGTGATNGKVIETEVNNVSLETVEVAKTRTKSNQTNERVTALGSNETKTSETEINSIAPATSDKKHTKTGHVTLLK